MSVPRTGLRAVLAAVTVAIAIAGVQAQTPEELFDRGNLAYGKGRFAEAAEAYRAAALYGIEDVRLDYNLGNAAFKMGNLGEAILHYERAYRLDPVDPDVLANLEFARSLRLDRVESAEVAAPARLARTATDRIGPDRLALAGLILVWIASGLVVWCSVRPSGWTPVAGWILALLLCLVLLAGLGWWYTCERVEGREMAVVLADSVEVLSGPGDNNAPLVTVHEGLALEVRSERDEWIQVRLPDGLNGWIPRRAIGFI